MPLVMGSTTSVLICWTFEQAAADHVAAQQYACCGGAGLGRHGHMSVTLLKIGKYGVREDCDVASAGVRRSNRAQRPFETWATSREIASEQFC